MFVCLKYVYVLNVVEQSEPDGQVAAELRRGTEASHCRVQDDLVDNKQQHAATSTAAATTIPTAASQHTRRLCSENKQHKHNNHNHHNGCLVRNKRLRLLPAERLQRLQDAQRLAHTPHAVHIQVAALVAHKRQRQRRWRWRWCQSKWREQRQTGLGHAT